MLGGSDIRRDDEVVSGCDPGRRRLVFGLSAALGAMFAVPVLDGCRKVKKAVGAVAGRPNERSKESPVESFDFHKYAPVSDGVVVDSHFESESAKTIVIFPDAHPGYSDSPAMLQLFERYQKFIFDNVVSLISMHGTVNFAPENSVVGTDERWFAKSTNPNLKDLKQIVGIPGDLSRRRFARDVVGTDPWNNASACLIAAYSSRGIKLRPVYTLPERIEVDKISSTVRAFSALAVSPEPLGCGDDSSMNFLQAKAKFEAGDRSEAVTDCFCAIHYSEADAVANMSKNRAIDAPRKEVDAALRSDSNFAVIVAGSWHLREAVKYMRERRVNYIVVAPFEYASGTVLDIFLERRVGHVLAPDPEGVCAKTRTIYEEMKRRAEER